MIPIIVFYLLVHSTVRGKSEPTDLCVGRTATSASVLDYCLSHNGSIEHRCCFSSNSTQILAIDLTDLNLVRVPDFTASVNLRTLNLIDLRSNPQLKPSVNLDFLALQSLDDLFLPDTFNCPGGQRTWQLIQNTSNPSGNRCLHQTDACSNRTSICPTSNSFCTPNGPTHFLCLCRTRYYGYKCLRYGTFPSAIFFPSTLLLTLAFTLFVYWTQRRHVKTRWLTRAFVYDRETRIRSTCSSSISFNFSFSRIVFTCIFLHTNDK